MVHWPESISVMAVLGRLKQRVVWGVWWKQTIILMVAVMASGCLVQPYVLTKDDVRARVTKDMKALTAIDEPVTGPIDLYEATARALKYNLDAKVKAMQAQLAH